MNAFVTIMQCNATQTNDFVPIASNPLYKNYALCLKHPPLNGIFNRNRFNEQKSFISTALGITCDSQIEINLFSKI